jgi:hypothetical protein
MQNVIGKASPRVSELPAVRLPSRLMSKCYGPITRCEGPYQGEADV